MTKNITCNWGHLFSQVENHDSHDEHGDDHHSDQGHHNHTKSSSKDDGNCCKDVTEKIFKSLSTLNQFAYSFKSIEYQTLNTFVIKFSSVKGNSDLFVNNYFLPPPKIPDIRVFIQSFNI